MQLQNLQNEKFKRNVLFDTAMKMIAGGKLFCTGTDCTDSIEYTRSGPNGELHDIIITGNDGNTIMETSSTMFNGTDETWYL